MSWEAAYYVAGTVGSALNIYSILDGISTRSDLTALQKELYKTQLDALKNPQKYSTPTGPTYIPMSREMREAYAANLQQEAQTALNLQKRVNHLGSSGSVKYSN
jgi:hypothetical protein